ncbi:MAG: hypothetical protein LBP72_00785 [Dysgonamonadaceae bacterium]|jgi:hypothetical protein|nr:hypothetical protein [Dysgonamonadaceae bacterium]
MKIKISVLSFALLLSVNLRAQVTIGGLTAPKAGALLDLNSTSHGGLVLSNVDLSDLSVIPGGSFVDIPATQDRNLELAGMIVYNINTTSGAGVHVWDGDDWIKLCAPPTPGPITFSDTTLCGAGVTFTAKIDRIKGAIGYVWTLPAGLTGTSNDTIITITGALEGVYPADSITVRAESACGGSSRRYSTQKIVINAIPAEPTDASSNSGDSGSSILFSATPAPGCTIDWYDADTGGTKVASGDSYSLPLNVTTTYYAESRDTTTECVSATRLAVIGTVKIFGTCIVSSLLDLTGKVEFVSTDTTSVRGGIIFSAPVKITDSKTTFDGGSNPNFKADYRDHLNLSGVNDTDSLGSWFSWCMVAQYADVLCPGQWQVPTKQNFQDYAGVDYSTTAIHEGIDDWLLGGLATSSDGRGQGIFGYYWSYSRSGMDMAYRARVSSGDFYPADFVGRNEGYSLRCVKIAP